MKFERALITGATSGIGEALARLLASKNIPLILSGRNQQKLEQMVKELNAEVVVIADLQNKVERQKLISVMREYCPDLVINNAGFGIYGDLLTIPIADQLATLEVNAVAPLEIMLEAARSLVLANKKGVILNVSSVAGEFPCPGMSVYGASKSFITKVSQALDTEISSKGVSILVSCPGMVTTEFSKRAAKKNVDFAGGPQITAQFAAEQIWKQIEKRQKKLIFNWQYRISSWLATYLVPTSLVQKIIWKRIKQRI